ncbi:MAG TPA: VTT domain-containing protein [Patescibacteria group bacterium]|nr:VTT domain-containing protein [Patescibacteria group bacterium]
MDIWGWMGDLVATYGYAGAFVISIFGNFTIFFPVPFAVTIYAFGATLNPLLLGLVCGLGSMLGEFSAYLVGRGGRRVIDERYGERLEGAKLLVQRHGMLLIFLFAVLPLPDDLILIPLGMLRYDLRKAMLAMFVGKTLMCIALAYAGLYSYDFVLGVFESSGIWGGLASVVFLAAVIIAMIKIDWTNFLKVETGSKAS